MNAPAWLTVLVTVMALAVAVFFAWRLVVAGGFNRAIEPETDVFYAAVGLALAGMLARWMRVLPPGVWAVVFGCATVWFVVRCVRAHRVGDCGARGRYAFDAGVASVLVYMPVAGVAPSTLRGSTAGMVTMAGMPGMMVDSTEHAPALGLLLVLGVVGGAVVLLDRLSAARSVVSERVGAADGDLTDQAAPLPPLLPRIAGACRILLLIVIAYAILGKLV